MEGQLRTANAKLVKLGTRVEDLKKALNDPTISGRHVCGCVPESDVVVRDQ